VSESNWSNTVNSPHLRKPKNATTQAASNNESRYLSSVQNYIKFRNSMCIATESFFVTDEGLPLSRKFFISHVKHILDKLGLSSEQYNGHSSKERYIHL
jgi:site-specific recombinase XerD